MLKNIILSSCFIFFLTNNAFGLNEDVEDMDWVICHPIPPKVFPLNGNLKTVFTYTITYTDPEGVAPNFIEVWIDDKIYPLEKVDTSDNNYANGTNYQYKTKLQAGTHKYSFATSDGIIKVKTPAFSGPVVMEEDYPHPAKVTTGN
ncbi:MAG: hypothetical protein QME42_06595 [bacterium]|nr:hypothetical protein [bacterium]